MQIFGGRAFHAEGAAGVRSPREDSPRAAGGGECREAARPGHHEDLALTRSEARALESPRRRGCSGGCVESWLGCGL